MHHHRRTAISMRLSTAITAAGLAGAASGEVFYEGQYEFSDMLTVVVERLDGAGEPIGFGSATVPLTGSAETQIGLTNEPVPGVIRADVAPFIGYMPEMHLRAGGDAALEVGGVAASLSGFSVSYVDPEYGVDDFMGLPQGLAFLDNDDVMSLMSFEGVLEIGGASIALEEVPAGDMLLSLLATYELRQTSDPEGEVMQRLTVVPIVEFDVTLGGAGYRLMFDFGEDFILSGESGLLPTIPGPGAVSMLAVGGMLIGRRADRSGRRRAG